MRVLTALMLSITVLTTALFAYAMATPRQHEPAPSPVPLTDRPARDQAHQLGREPWRRL
jgi:hypothetical protein